MRVPLLWARQEVGGEEEEEEGAVVEGEEGEEAGLLAEGEVEARYRPGPLDQQPTATDLQSAGIAGHHQAPAPPQAELLAEQSCLTLGQSWTMSRL